MECTVTHNLVFLHIKLNIVYSNSGLYKMGKKTADWDFGISIIFLWNFLGNMFTVSFYSNLSISSSHVTELSEQLTMSDRLWDVESYQ